MTWPFRRRGSSQSLLSSHEHDTHSETGGVRMPGSTGHSSNDPPKDSVSLGSSSSGPMPSGNTSNIGAILIIANSALGAAITNLPYAYMCAGGVLHGVLIQLVIAILVFVSLQILVIAAERYNGTSYEGLLGNMWGRYWRHTVEVIILLYAFFSSIMYLILLGDQMDYVIDNFTHVSPGAVDNADRFREIAIVVSAIIVLPLCIPADISYLSYPGSVSVIGIVYLAIIVVVRYFDLSHHDSHFNSHSDWPTVISAVPPFLFGYHCHLAAVPLFASLKNRSPANWAFITASALTIVTTLYFIVAMCGYFTFGVSVQDDILLNYETHDKAITFGRFMLLCCVITSYPNMHYVGRSAVMSMFSSANQNAHISACHNAAFYSFTSFWLLFTLAAALFIPQIEIVIGPIGACAAFFVLGFPGMCLLKMSEYSKWWLPQILLVLILVSISVFIFTCSFLKFFV